MDAPFSVETRPFFFAWCICLVVLELAGVGIARTRAPLDFKEFYAAGYLLRTNPSHLYDVTLQHQAEQAATLNAGFIPFYHPSYETLLYAPFALLSYRSAYLAFIAFNMLLLMAAFLAVRPVFSSIIPVCQPRPGLMFFVFVPVLMAVIVGQDAILSLLIYCLTWQQLKLGKDARAGCFLALGLFKFPIVLPIALLIAVWRGWRFTFGFIAASVGVVLLCIAVAGPAGTMQYIRLVFDAASVRAVAQQQLDVAPSAMPNFRGLLYVCGARFLPSAASNALTAIFSLGSLIWCARTIRNRGADVAFSIAVLCGLLLSYHICISDLTLALLPVALMTGQSHRYIAVVMFILAILLIFVGIGFAWFSLMAFPILAMLVNGILSSRSSEALALAATPATPA